MKFFDFLQRIFVKNFSGKRYVCLIVPSIVHSITEYLLEQSGLFSDQRKSN